MDGINNFLQKYIHLHKETVDHKRELIELVKQKVGVRLQSSQIEIDNKRITLKAAGPLRTELLLKKGAIENVLKEAYDYTLILR